MDNRAALARLFASGRIALQRSPLFDSTPSSLPADWLLDRIEGMLLGLAIGDGLGNTTESLTPDQRSQRYGVIRDYLPNRHAGNRPVGLPSDDTQLALWTLEQLLLDGSLVPEHLARRFCQQWIFGIGGATREFIRRYKDEGFPWYEAGTASAGNGALMRIAPVLIPHLTHPTPAIWADTALAAMITHNDPASTGSCLALVRVLWDVLGMSSPPRPEWWIDAFCSALQPLEGQTTYQTRTPHLPYQGPLWHFANTYVRQALRDGVSTRNACDWWYSGAYLMETVPSVLYILARYAHDPEEAVVRAVNDTRDNDTVAAIVGAVVGALHGRSGLPQRWIEGLLGRTGEADDGRVFELILRTIGGRVCGADDLRPEDVLETVDEIHRGDVVFFVRLGPQRIQLRVLGKAYRQAFSGPRYRIDKGEDSGSLVYIPV